MKKNTVKMNAMQAAISLRSVMYYITFYKGLLNEARNGGPGDVVYMEKHHQEWVDLRDALLNVAELSLEDVTDET